VLRRSGKDAIEQVAPSEQSGRSPSSFMLRIRALMDVAGFKPAGQIS
jgi:hypothetical protein